ncbi:hypothetical protein KP509_07G020200 [Ceratopteris richardii]|uniref:Uncharacterized protein n=1 Tax=Ceratopteris richardii TaxID=49495 RepID=A0A8T2UET3_CERRI|nr:hypothetical protein KP509_07G020200 [Ceratopteris richardii]
MIVPSRTPTIDSRSPIVTLTFRGKTFIGVIIDGGSGINLMIHYTMLLLGLKMTKKASFTMTLVYESRVQPLGIVEQVLVLIQKIQFFLSFVVVDVPCMEGGYPLLIGRPWLRHHHALDVWSNDTLLVNAEGHSRQYLYLDDKNGEQHEDNTHSFFIHKEKEVEVEDDQDLLHWIETIDSFTCNGINIIENDEKVETIGLGEPILDHRRGKDKMSRYYQEHPHKGSKSSTGYENL